MTNREKFIEIFHKDLYEVCRENKNTVCSTGKKLEECKKCNNFNSEFWNKEFIEINSLEGV